LAVEDTAVPAPLSVKKPMLVCVPKTFPALASKDTSPVGMPLPLLAVTEMSTLTD
jgi:hypothetical protein